MRSRRNIVILSFHRFNSKTSKSYYNITQKGPRSYNLKLSKLKAIRKLNYSVETVKLQPTNDVTNEYGYHLPTLNTGKMESKEEPKHLNSPRLNKKFLNHSIDIRDSNSSYIKEEYKNVVVKFGVCSQAGSNPMNPVKPNQDSYITIDAKE